MSGILIAWSCAAGAVTLLVLSHAAYVRLARPRRRFTFIFAGLPIAVLAAAGGAYVWQTPTLDSRWLELAQGTLFLLFAVQIASSLYAALEHAIRGGIASEVHRSPSSRIRVAELIRRYDPDGAAMRRVSMLLETGYLRHDSQGRFALTAKGRRFAVGAMFLKNFFGIGRGG